MAWGKRLGRSFLGGWLPLSHQQTKNLRGIAIVLVRLDHIASVIVNADHSIM